MRTALQTSTLIPFFAYVCACSAPHPIDCADALSTGIDSGLCVGQGVVVSETAGFVEYLDFPNGERALIDLSSYPEIEHGSVIRIEATFTTNPKGLDLTEYRSVTLIDAYDEPPERPT